MAQPRYVTDETGERVAILLDIDEYERMLRRIKALEAISCHPAVLAFLAALEDEEALTDADLQALREAEDDIQAGRVVSHEEAKQQLLG